MSDSTLYLFGYHNTLHSGLNKFELDPIDFNRIQRKVNSIPPDSLILWNPAPDAQRYKLFIGSDKDSIQIEGILDLEDYKLKAFIFYMLHLDRLKNFKPSEEQVIPKFRFNDNYQEYLEK